MKKEYKPRYATCKSCKFDNPVEPHQAMTIQEMLVAYTAGHPLPDTFSNGYDEDITIDDVGYSVGDRLEAVDYLNAVNRRIASSKAEVVETPTTVETPTNV